MIRRRQSSVDNRTIFRIITAELLPKARQSFPNMKISRQQVLARLKKAVTFVVAKEKQPPSGFITIVPRNGLLYIDMLAVKKSEQGAGLGSRLVRRAEQYGVRHGCREAFLYVDEGNEHAKRFYVSNGFTEMKHIPRIKCFLYTKPLEGGQKEIP